MGLNALFRKSPLPPVKRNEVEPQDMIKRWFILRIRVERKRVALMNGFSSAMLKVFTGFYIIRLNIVPKQEEKPHTCQSVLNQAGDCNDVQKVRDALEDG